MLPALGPLLDLKRGVWNHEHRGWEDTKLAGLTAPVDVFVDASGVPHIFATTEPDLYLVQGYLIASQRLFQMDIYSRSNVGRISELAGVRALPIDRFFTKFGMRRAEASTRAAILKTPESKVMVESFVNGANAWIRELTSATLPPEYKILGAKPKEFTASLVSAMAKTMSFSLAGGSSDIPLTQMAKLYSVGRVLDLFPEFLPEKYEDVVLPDIKTSAVHARETSRELNLHIKDLPEIPRPPGFNGSNNWVIGPKKSTTGFSILANDTHLGLSLPNVWYEVQLHTPEFNVYGVGFANVPGIVNGFNTEIAWGPTNGYTDVLDYYEIEFKDETSLEYRDRDQWRQAEVDHEQIHIKRAKPITIDLPWTKWGPVIYREGKYGLVVRWTGHQATNELLPLRKLWTATTAKECMQIFALWHVPIQNFACADAKHIGLVHAGDIPDRNVGEGRFLETPERTKSQLTKFIAPSARPQVFDPPSGYIRSANERVLNSNGSYNYMGWSYEDAFRAQRIRQLLEEKPQLSSEDMIRIQNDDLDMEAATILPWLLKNLDPSRLGPGQLDQIQILEKWDYRAQTTLVAPSLYKAWYQAFKQKLFIDNCPKSGQCIEPKDMRIAWLLERLSNNPQDSDRQWLTSSETANSVSLGQVVTDAWSQGLKNLEKAYGPDPSKWTWFRYNHTSLKHLARIPGFGSEILDMSGAGDSVRGNRGWHGAVYKLVVELGPKLRAWIQVPGGNSGDPFSPNYERFVKDWSSGTMREVEFYTNIEDARKRAAKMIRFTPEGS
jgi:penicillin amidase